MADVFLLPCPVWYTHTGSDFHEYQIKISANYTVLANFISHTLIHPMGKINIKNFHGFDIFWLYRTSWYAIVKVEVSERNEVTKHHGIVIPIWRTSAIEVTALSKAHFQK